MKFSRPLPGPPSRQDPVSMYGDKSSYFRSLIGPFAPIPEESSLFDEDAVQAPLSKVRRPMLQPRSSRHYPVTITHIESPSEFYVAVKEEGAATFDFRALAQDARNISMRAEVSWTYKGD